MKKKQWLGKLKIDWDNFTNNSSECDALCEFAKEEITFAELQKRIWSSEAKLELEKLKNRPVKNIRTTVKRAIKHYYILD
jgi:hypothetical protein